MITQQVALDKRDLQECNELLLLFRPPLEIAKRLEAQYGKVSDPTCLTRPWNTSHFHKHRRLEPDHAIWEIPVGST